MNKSILELKDQIMNQSLIAILFLCLLNMYGIINRFFEFGITKLFIIDILLSFTVILTAILRKQIHLHIKLGIVTIAGYIAFFNGLNNLGFLASGKFYMVLIPILVSFFLDFKYTLGVILFFLISYIIFAFLFLSGEIEYTIEPNIYLDSANGWIFDVIISIGLVWAISHAGSRYIKTLNKQLKLIKTQNGELKFLRKDLEKLVDKKTKSLTEANKKLELTIKNLQESQLQLINSEKMASLGVLTAGVAHDINNPLNYIMGAYEGLKANYEEHKNEKEQENVEKFLEALKLGLDRSTDIVKSLNQFSRNNESLNEDCDLHLILDNTVSMLNSKLKNKVEVVKDYDVNKLFIKGNIGSLHQVFLNIIGNSIEAIETNGEIKIKTENLKSEIKISIKDNGLGIPKENIAKIKDLFFTTKTLENRLGSGLGLYISYKIIEKHKGFIEITSEVGKGTLVEIVLPKQ